MRLRDRVWPGLPARSLWFEAFVALAGTAVVLVGSAQAPDFVLAPGAVLLVVTLFLFRRSAPLIPFTVSAALVIAAPQVSIALMLTSYAVGRYIARWPVRLVALVIGAVGPAQPWLVDTLSGAVFSLGAVAVTMLLPGALGIWQRTRSLLVDALRDRAERAEAERELLAREAVLDERTRIAREMHDAVGHRVSLMVLQAGAIEMAARDADRVTQLAGQVQTAGRHALDELRQMVGVLRGDEVDEDAPLGPQPGLDDVPRLVNSAREAGMDAELRGPDADPVDSAVGRAAYRIVQEALTNAGKHAPGSQVCVTLARPAGELVVRVVNTAGGEATGVSGGFGLVGLAERVRTLGGRLDAGPRLDGGFVVEAVLPA
jgi:signal transduction histidine kinase